MRNQFKRRYVKIVKSNPEVVLAIAGKTVYHYKGNEYIRHFTHSVAEQEFMKLLLKEQPFAYISNRIK
jgi:hypothetical protein